MKHPVYPAAVNDGFRCTIALDGQVAAVQDVQVAAGVGVFTRCPRQEDGNPVSRCGKGDDVGARVVLGVGDGLAQGTRPAVIGIRYEVVGGPGRLRTRQ